MRSIRLISWFLTGCVLVGPQAALVAQIAPPLDVRVPAPPSPVLAEGEVHLVYELHVTNFSTRGVSLTSVSVHDAERDAQLVAYSGESLVQVLRRVGVTGQANDDSATFIDAGMRTVMYVWAKVAEDGVPRGLLHRISVSRVGENGDTTTLELETEPQVVGPPAVIIGPPLRGENWFAGNGPDNVTGHRRALIPIEGKARIAQRFAIDWVQIVGERTNRGDREDNSTYHAWGAEALAVDDGIVVDIKDGIPENVPGIDSRAVPITLETVGGNYVILDIGEGRYAFYAHLQPGTLRVAVADRVRRGDVVGLVGNSGNSTEPHLHFHVADSPSPLGSEGIPYVFDAFEVTGRSTGFGAEPRRFPAQRRTREIPLANVFVTFPGF